MKNEYNSYFFNELYEGSGDGSYLDAKRWIPFFSKVAQKIVDQFNPSTVLDAGCACGYLVAALHDLGVKAYGFDVSKFAISNVRDDVKDYCFVHNITEPLPAEYPDTYDLVVTSQVLELLFPAEGEKAISLLCSYSDTVIFSSSPTDIEDRTHVNVQLPEYWAEIFYNNSFAKNFIFDMSIMSPWCVVYEKFTDLKKLIFKYEQNMRIDKMTTEKNVNDTINDLMESLLNVTSKIYFEGGEGFSDEKVLILPQKLNDSYLSINIRIPDNTKSIKFAPIESEYCLLKNVEIYLDNRQIHQYETNGELIQNFILYNNLDPYIIIDQTQGRKHLKIHAKFQHIEEEFLQLYQGKNKTVDETIANLGLQVSAAEATFVKIQEDLKVKDGLILEKETELNNKNSVISMQNMTLEEKDNRIAELDGMVAEKITTLGEKMSEIEQKDDLLQKNKEFMDEQATALASKDGILTEKLSEIESLKGKITEVESSLAALENAEPTGPSPEELEAFEGRIREKEAELTEKDDLIGELQDQIAENLSATAQVDEKLAEKDAIISEKEVALREKTNALTKKEAAYDELQAAVLAKEASVSEKENAFATMDDELVEKNLKISSLEGRLAMIEGEYQAVLAKNQALSAEASQSPAPGDGGKNGSLLKAFRGDENKKDSKAKKTTKKTKPVKEKKEKPVKAKKEKATKAPKTEKAKKPVKGNVAEVEEPEQLD